MFARILLPIDLVEPSSWSTALPVALRLSEDAAGAITLMTVLADWKASLNAQWSPFAYPRMIKEAEEKLRGIARDCGSVCCAVEVAGGSIATGILDSAERIEADLIVLASHRPGLRDYLIGANALHVVRHATCSVLVVRERETGSTPVNSEQ
jgi:nucleotide-binding universal stress UspA family protein